MKLLLIEDDPMIGQALQRLFARESYALDWATDGQQGESALLAFRYDAVILDLMLPRMDGLTVLRRLRDRRDATPVLALTALDGITDRVRGLDTGADDYIVKPVDFEELSARVRALLRRARVAPDRPLRVGEVDIDLGAREVRLRGAPVDLTAREYGTLERLARMPGRLVSKAEIEEAIYAWDAIVASNAVEVYIHQLRRKLGEDVIHTVRGRGYRLGPGA